VALVYTALMLSFGAVTEKIFVDSWKKFFTLKIFFHYDAYDGTRWLKMAEHVVKLSHLGKVFQNDFSQNPKLRRIKVLLSKFGVRSA